VIFEEITMRVWPPFRLWFAHMRAGVAAFLCVLLCTFSSHALADERRDFMLDQIPEGNFLTLDYFGTGGQLSLEHHEPIYGASNDFVSGVNTLLAYPLAQASAYSSLRILFLELGGMIGYRSVWRSLQFDAGKDSYCVDCSRVSRRRIDPIFGASLDTDRYVYAEAKAALYAPFNEYVLFTSQLVARYEDSHDRSYDWFFTSVHDGGVITRSESMLFFKHRDWGGIAPYVQLMFLPRGPKHEMEVAYGFNAVRRLGLIDRDDLLFLTFLIRPGDGYYGQHDYHAPIRALLVYRMILAL
jgi:hypothetical protein